MQPKQSSRQLFRKRGLHYFIPILFVILSVFIYWVFSQFRIVEVQVISEQEIGQPNGLDILKGSNLLLINEQELEDRIIKLNPEFSTVKVAKLYPSSLEIKVEHADQVALLTLDIGYYVLDSSGKVLRKVEKDLPDLPVINFYQKLNSSAYSRGEKVTLSEISAALLFLSLLKDLGLSVNTIDINSLGVIAFNLSSGQILFTVDKDLGTQEYQVEAIVRQLKIKGQDFETLDVRFEKPVIKFKNTNL